MKESFYRTAMLLGEEAEERLNRAHVIVFGAGGVGGHCVDALVRSGLGNITVIDSALVICATKYSIGMKKVDAMEKHIRSVSDCRVTSVHAFALPENIAELLPDDTKADVIIDAVDTVTAKLAIIERASALDIPILSSMGAGNRLDPTKVRIADIYSTSIDPLSRVMRRELKKRNIPSLTVVYSVEEPIKPLIPTPDPDMKPNAPASAEFVPACFGLALASEAVKLMLK